MRSIARVRVALRSPPPGARLGKPGLERDDIKSINKMDHLSV
jgi:hypothetical protein